VAKSFRVNLCKSPGRTALLRRHLNGYDIFGDRSNLALVNSIRSSLLVLLAIATTGTLTAQSDWDDPFPPHRIADHLYYVGSKGLATYLITTTQFQILQWPISQTSNKMDCVHAGGC